MTLRTERLEVEPGRRIFYRSIVPASTRGALLVLHGYAEHSGIYVGVLRFLAAHGWACFAPDVRGHGQSGDTPADLDSLEGVLADIHALRGEARRQVPAGPFFTVAHSLGGLLALLDGLRHQRELAGLVLSAPLASIPNYASPFLVRISGVLARILPLLPVQPFDYRAVSHDPAVVAALEGDPLYYKGRVRCRTGYNTLQGIQRLQDTLSALTLPLLLLQGEGDRTVELEATELVMRLASSSDKTRRILPGFRHVLLQGTGSPQVLEEIAAWLESHRT